MENSLWKLYEWRTDQERFSTKLFCVCGIVKDIETGVGQSNTRGSKNLSNEVLTDYVPLTVSAMSTKYSDCLMSSYGFSNIETNSCRRLIMRYITLEVQLQYLAVVWSEVVV